MSQPARSRALGGGRLKVLARSALLVTLCIAAVTDAVSASAPCLVAQRASSRSGDEKVKAPRALSTFRRWFRRYGGTLHRSVRIQAADSGGAGRTYRLVASSAIAAGEVSSGPLTLGL